MHIAVAIVFGVGTFAKPHQGAFGIELSQCQVNPILPETDEAMVVVHAERGTQPEFLKVKE
jgi:hypothetical protein